MTKKIYRLRNWSDYNKALVSRGSVTVWIHEKSLDRWQYQGRRTRGGVKRYSDVAITVALTLKEVYRLTYRSCQGFIQSLMNQRGGVNLPVPDYSTLCRRARSLRIRLGKVDSRKPLCVLVDSTGVRVFGQSEWYAFLHKKRKRHAWRKLHLAVDYDSLTVLSSKVTDAYVHDAKYLDDLLSDLPQKLPVESIIGDGSYTSYECYYVAQKRKSELIAPPHKNARKQSENRAYSRASPAKDRDEAIEYIRHYEDRLAGLKAWKKEKHYHRRSLVETSMFRLKTLFGDQVRANTLHAQEQIMKLRCLAMNRMTELGMPISVPIH